MKRREFLKNTLTSALSVSALGSAPFALSNQAFASSQTVFIKVFLRGGIDGLSVLVPTAGAQYQAYSAARTTQKIGRGQTLRLKGESRFRLHPEAKRMRGFFNNDQAIFAHGAGSLNDTRSHFTQMDIIEGGNKDVIAGSGYIYRALGSAASGLDMVSIGGGVAASMKGSGSQAVAMGSPESFARIQGAHGHIRPVLSKADRIAGMSGAYGGCAAFKTGSAYHSVCVNAIKTADNIDEVDKNLSSLPNLDRNKYGNSKGAEDLSQAVRLACSSLSP